MAALSARRWQQVAPHLDRALDLAEAERATWLAGLRAQDPVMAADLERLLDDHHALAGSGFLEQLPSAVADQQAKAKDPFGLVGQIVDGRFEVECQVAEGGFGIVYRAHQLVLDRTVALKVLKTPSDLTAAQRATFHRTFEEEARTIARLKHPHIVEVHDFGVVEREGGPLLWMALEWLEGKTLEEHLNARQVPLTAIEALGLLRPALQTIGYAHRQQVVHRDLKPANIFLAERDGAVTLKVLDFGIAKMMAGGDGPAASGTTKGFRAFSPAYAAPEQIAHGRTGAFTDVHALGLILTQMLTGRPPYEGIQGDVFLAAMAERRPSPAAAGFPAGAWEPVLAKAMALRPVERHQNADELLEALEKQVPAASGVSAPATPAAPERSRWRVPLVAALAVVTIAAFVGGYLALRPRNATTVLVAPDRIRLAVLPIRNLSGDPKQDSLGDALTDGVIAQLGRLRPEQLSVIARGEVMRYKGTGKSAGEIGQELGVTYLLDASIKPQGTEMRVDAQLVRVSDLVAIWGDSYTGGIADVQLLQNDLARGVAKGIRLKLGDAAERALVRKRPVKPEAYEAYLRAHFTPFDGKDSVTKVFVSLAAYEEAVRIDPTFALAHAGVATTSLYLTWAGGDVKGRRARARAAALRAVELDPELPQAQAALGAVLFVLYGDWAEGERYLRRALLLDPNQELALENISRLWITVGRFRDAIAARQRAVELDPLSSFVARNLANTYYFARQYDAAIEVLQRTIAADEKFLPAHTRLALCYVQKGTLAEAVAVEDRVKDHPQKELPENLAVAGFVYARAGRVTEARRMIEMLIAQGKVLLPALEIARVHAGLGDREGTLRWLEKAYEKRDENIFHLISMQVDPMWDLVRADPRFSAIVRGMAIPPLAVGG